jgi:DNA-binding NarL/FixJ family response regulator
MNYINAKIILPEKLLIEIQKYIQGGYVYIPSKPQERKKWGERSGYRDYLRNRNEDIRRMYKSGYTIRNLAEQFFLSVDSIKKIVYTKDV